MNGPGPSNRSSDPTVRFLGPGVRRNGPFGVLGLAPIELDDQTIVHAVHERIAMIDRHPEARTPAADEARLAVHAAAANLLDPAIREALLQRLGHPSHPPTASATSQAPTPNTMSASGAIATHPPANQRPVPRPSLHPASDYQLEADLLRSIGTEGGWGPAARDRFIKLAHARGVDARTAAASIKGLTGTLIQTRAATDRPVQTPRVSDAAIASPLGPSLRADSSVRIPAVQHGTAHPRIGHGIENQAVRNPAMADAHPEVMRTERDSSMLASVLIVSAIVVVMVLAAGVTLLIVGGESAPPALNTPPPRAVRAPTAPSDTEQPHAPSTPVSRPLDHAPAILHELEVAGEGLAVDPDAAFTGFELAVESLAERWGGFSVSDRLAAQDHIIGFLYRVSGRADLLNRAIDAIAGGVAPVNGGGIDDARAVWRAAWSMGTLVRLRRETNLPGSIARRIDGIIAPVFSGGAPNAESFRAGAIAVLGRIADPISGSGLGIAPREAWDAWVAAVGAASLGDADLVSSMLIGAADARARDASHNATTDGDALAALIGAMDWSDDSPARVWLVRAFDDRSLGVDELHALTLTLANASAAGGVNFGMVLPRGAGESDRRALRDRYRELWAIAEDADRDETLSAFLAAARGALATEPAGGDDGFGLTELASAVRYARLNASAAMLWRADLDDAADLLRTLDAPIDAVLSADGVPDLSGLLRPSGGTWAEEYISAGSHIERRLELLSIAGGRTQLGPMDAEVIVAEALRGSPLRVREAASLIVESEAGSAVVVNAMLEALPILPKTTRNGLLIERVAGAPLPGMGDPYWEREARRALVERLLELIAGRGGYARLDALSELLDDAYAARATTPGSANPKTGDARSRASTAEITNHARVHAQDAARSLVSRWITAAERRPPAPIPGLSIDTIRSRRAARLSAADGIVQTFHAHQLALAEVMAQVIASEGKAQTVEVRGLLETLTRARRQSRSVLRQIELTERFMLHLWTIRLEEGL